MDENTHVVVPEVTVRLDRLQAGDVLLTNSPGKDARWIGRFSEGKGKVTFSHAAFCVSPFFIFESDGDIIGYKPLVPFGWAMVGSNKAFLGRIPSDPFCAAVYRHPDIATISRESFDAAVEEEVRDSFGKDYSRFHRLVRIADTPFPGVRRLFASGFQFAEEWLWKEQIPGPFCSELVAKIFDRLNLPLYNASREPSGLSPNMLARSKLKRQRSLVLRTSLLTSVELAAIEVASINHNIFAVYARQQRGLKETLDRFEYEVLDNLKSANRTLFAKLLEGHRQFEPVVLRLLQEADGQAPDVPKIRARRLAALYIDVLAQLSSFTDIINYPPEVLGALNRAHLFSRSLSRCTALHASMEFRKMLKSVNGDLEHEIDERRRDLLIQTRRMMSTSHGWDAVLCDLAAHAR